MPYIIAVLYLLWRHNDHLTGHRNLYFNPRLDSPHNMQCVDFNGLLELMTDGSYIMHKSNTLVIMIVPYQLQVCTHWIMIISTTSSEILQLSICIYAIKFKSYHCLFICFFFRRLGKKHTKSMKDVQIDSVGKSSSVHFCIMITLTSSAVKRAYDLKKYIPT